MTADPVKVMARAIYESVPRHPRAEWDTEPVTVREAYRSSARAALAALDAAGLVVVPREASPAMDLAGELVIIDAYREAIPQRDVAIVLDARKVWAAMLSAAPTAQPKEDA